MEHLLEISSKSDREIGRRLSAFHQRIHLKDGRVVSLECAFQGSKVFESGGPFADLLDTEPRDAKRDVRLKVSASLCSQKAFSTTGYMHARFSRSAIGFAV
jgi:GrpB-like predicted nucleotidyltransferase (UPF0157 family)